ncbi:hypothetical protein BABINDRAFT_159212 [Babjeviella inositovora NRRL Y-12698]|uniref:IMD domain-containing protein n=1 Tax=Babjeviella inositovora NRRL Y-12698 TaxID=984486 RepID=A0A1E3R022_9ASCO|nr:uncharacterized protein BABINDRAFT_159212 [Babjeviella inositovora NRRL Y-12698]ODQ82682.1 hypothetical protein BABINDRAFT_159212 [Babjeviella inositovora NRRL Y-12698]
MSEPAPVPMPSVTPVSVAPVTAYHSPETTAHDSRPPDHLSEFYSLLQGNQNRTSESFPRTDASFAPPLARRASNTTFSSIGPSVMDLPSLITASDVLQTKQSFLNLVRQAGKYREALLLVSEAASGFALALEDAARCKGSGAAADGLLSAGGLHYLVANHQQILALSIKSAFEVPVEKEIEAFETSITRAEAEFRTTIRAKNQALRARERENLRLSRMKSRNLAQYRTTLQALTFQVDEIDRLKHDYYLSSFEIVQAASERVLDRAGSVVRAQVEIYEGIARKGWSGGGLDDLIAQCPDPFNPDDEDEEAHLNGETTQLYVSLINTPLNSQEVPHVDSSTPTPTLKEEMLESLSLADPRDGNSDGKQESLGNASIKLSRRSSEASIEADDSFSLASPHLNR